MDSSNVNYTDTNNEYTENLNEHKEIYQKITSSLKNAQKEILFLISNEEVYIKNKDEVWEFVSIINRKNIDTRIMIPKFHESRLLINEIDKNSKAIFQYLCKPVCHNIVILVIDTKTILVLESKQENNLSKNGKQYFLYSNKSSQVQTYTLLFESCWISATIHEQNI